MPMVDLPQSAHPAAVLGAGDVAISNPVELGFGVGVLFYGVSPGSAGPSLRIDLDERKADLALVFATVEAMDQTAAALAEARSVLVRRGLLSGPAAPSAAVALLTPSRVRRFLLEGLAQLSFFDAGHGDSVPMSEVRRLLDDLDRQGRA